jgi:hypothetical protein
MKSFRIATCDLISDGDHEMVKQMLFSPKGAIFIVSNHAAIKHAERIANILERKDIEVISAYQFNVRMAGRTTTGILVDSAARLTQDECRAIEESWAARVTKTKGGAK